ncbi:hypothetical protein H4684_002016 [Desulfomicrobium macestii]|uniref:Uncharacterized protein n=1 Tax=Desulfomicrobium macestii TaxID=90731 RepID=A0ABR9H3S3_9BACT|nr:hypothetical protein [Desulfomicrobium macestii]
MDPCAAALSGEVHRSSPRRRGSMAWGAVELISTEVIPAQAGILSLGWWGQET